MIVKYRRFLQLIERCRTWTVKCISVLPVRIKDAISVILSPFVEKAVFVPLLLSKTIVLTYNSQQFSKAISSTQQLLYSKKKVPYGCCVTRFLDCVSRRLVWELEKMKTNNWREEQVELNGCERWIDLGSCFLSIILTRGLRTFSCVRKRAGLLGEGERADNSSKYWLSLCNQRPSRRQICWHKPIWE